MIFDERPNPVTTFPKVSMEQDKGFLLQLRADISDILVRHHRIESRFDQQAIVLVGNQAIAKSVAEGLGEDATYIISGKVGSTNLKEFTSHQKKIGVVCGMLLEGYDNANVTLAVILRKCQSRVLFEQFVGRFFFFGFHT